MTGFGYAHPSGKEARYYLSPRSYMWVRQRCAYVDRVFIWWGGRTTASHYWLQWETTQTERRLDGRDSARMHVWRIKSGRLDAGATWFGWFSPIALEVRLLLHRLGELEDYLQSGVPTRHVGLWSPGAFGIPNFRNRAPPLPRWKPKSR